jgi:hypothetical protein
MSTKIFSKYTGVCSACQDITQILTFACCTTQVDWIQDLKGWPSNYYPNGTVCGYFLNGTSDTTVLMSGYNLHALNSSRGSAAAREALFMRTLPLRTNPLRTNPLRNPLWVDGFINFKHILHIIQDFIVVSAG